MISHDTNSVGAILMQYETQYEFARHNMKQ